MLHHGRRKGARVGCIGGDLYERIRECVPLRMTTVTYQSVIERPNEFHIKILPVPDAENPADNKGK